MTEKQAEEEQAATIDRLYKAVANLTHRTTTAETEIQYLKRRR